MALPCCHSVVDRYPFQELSVTMKLVEDTAFTSISFNLLHEILGGGNSSGVSNLLINLSSDPSS